MVEVMPCWASLGKCDGGCVTFLGLHNELPQTEWFKQRRFIVAQFSRWDVQSTVSTGLPCSVFL